MGLLPVGGSEHRRMSAMTEPTLDDYEKELVRFFAQRYLDHQGVVGRGELPRQKELDEHREAVALNRLDNAGLIDIVSRSEVKVLPACVKVAQRWDNPPPAPLPDYRDRLSKWFWSKRWSLGVYALVVGLPAALGYLVMVKTICEWLGIIKGGPPR
jgi:hypothetical protein